MGWRNKMIRGKSEDNEKRLRGAGKGEFFWVRRC